MPESMPEPETAIKTNTHKVPPLKRTAGEKAFDWQVYGGVGYLVNLVLSIGAIWAADRTHTGRRVIEGTAQRLSRMTGINVETMRNQVRFTSLLSGGFAVLPPIKWLEDRKTRIVKEYDAAHYEAIPNADDLLAQAHERLENEPKQTWASVIGSRFLAMVPFYTFTGMAMKRNQALSRLTGEAIYGEKLIARAARGIDAAVHSGNPKALAEIAEKNRKYPNNTVNNLDSGELERPVTALADYAMTEAACSGIVAGFLYVFTRLTAPFLGKPQAPKDMPFSPVVPIEGLKETPPPTRPKATNPSASPASQVTTEQIAAQRLLPPSPQPHRA